MARLKVKQISDYVSATESLVSAGISSEISATNSDVNSLDARISTDEVGLSSEISATNSDILSVAAVAGDATALSNEVSATNSDVNSLDARISTDEVALSSEVSATNSDVNSIDARISGDEVGLSSEVSATNSDVTSLEAQFNSFAKEPYVHGVLSDIVTGGGMTVQVLDTSGGANGDNVTDNAGTAVFDLSQPIEGANVVDFAANFAEFTINGLGIKHNALRFNSSTNVALDYTALGYNLEADDVIEYKYIKD